jgi:hypothetical protein
VLVLVEEMDMGIKKLQGAPCKGAQKGNEQPSRKKEQAFWKVVAIELNLTYD